MSNQTPLVSVIMSVYNSEKTLTKALNSIINQSYKNIEILVLDDGSNDSSNQILKNYASYISKIRIFKNESNLGLTKSLNILIKESYGQLIARQDSDDISCETRIEKQVKALVSQNLDFCTTRSYRNNSKKLIPRSSFYLPEKLVMKYKNPFIHGTLLINKSAFINVGLYDENFYYAQDYKLFFDLINGGAKYKVLREPLYRLNMNNNISTLNRSEQRYFANCVKKKLLPIWENPNNL